MMLPFGCHDICKRNPEILSKCICMVRQKAKLIIHNVTNRKLTHPLLEKSLLCECFFFPSFYCIIFHFGSWSKWYKQNFHFFMLIMSEIESMHMYDLSISSLVNCFDIPLRDTIFWCLSPKVWTSHPSSPHHLWTHLPHTFVHTKWSLSLSMNVNCICARC